MMEEEKKIMIPFKIKVSLYYEAISNLFTSFPLSKVQIFFLDFNYTII